MFKIIAIIFIWTLPIISCISLGEGSDTLIKENANKRKTRKADLFLREAGATVADSYQVSIADNDNRFNNTSVGNTFIVDAVQSKTGLNENSVNINWIAEDSL